MTIRQARQDEGRQIAPLVLQAMEEMVLQFTNSRDLTKGINLFETFISQTANQYSFENTLVAVENEEVIGSVTAYDGAKLTELRRPFLDYIKKHYAYNQIPEEETEAGEFYIDTLSVSVGHQGKGIGKSLIEAVIAKGKAKGFSKIGLLVAIENPKAKSLYERMGFKSAGIKNLMGGKYEHLVCTA